MTFLPEMSSSAFRTAGACAPSYCGRKAESTNSARWLRFRSAADEDERQSHDQEGGGCGNVNLRGVLFVEGSLERANLRNLLLLMVGVGGMQNCSDAEQEQHNADNCQSAFHGANLSMEKVTSRSCASRFGRGPYRPLHRKGGGIRLKRWQVLRMGSCSGGGNFLGSLSSFGGRGRFAAPFGLGWRGRGFADQLRVHHASDEQLWAMVIKIDRGTLLVRCRHDSQAVHLMLDSLSFLHCLHNVLLDHSLDAEYTLFCGGPGLG